MMTIPIGMSYMSTMTPQVSAQMPGSTPEPITPSQPSGSVGYAQQLLGQAPMEFDEQGRYGITEGQQHEAFKGAASQILTGISAAMLGKNPMAITEAISQAGQMYKRDMDKASAMNIANRTMQYQEAATRLQLDKGLTENEREKLLLDEMKRTAEVNQGLRGAARAAAEADAKFLRGHMEEMLKRGEINQDEIDTVEAYMKVGAIQAGNGNMEGYGQTFQGIISSGIVQDATIARLGHIQKSKEAAAERQRAAYEEVTGRPHILAVNPETGELSVVDKEAYETRQEYLDAQIDAMKRGGRGDQAGDAVLGRTNIMDRNDAENAVYSAISLVDQVSAMQGSGDGAEYRVETQKDKELATSWNKALTPLRVSGYSDAILTKALKLGNTDPEFANGFAGLVADLNGLEGERKQKARVWLRGLLVEYGVIGEDEPVPGEGDGGSTVPSGRGRTAGVNQPSANKGQGRGGAAPSRPSAPSYADPSDPFAKAGVSTGPR